MARGAGTAGGGGVTVRRSMVFWMSFVLATQAFAEVRETSYFGLVPPERLILDFTKGSNPPGMTDTGETRSVTLGTHISVGPDGLRAGGQDQVGIQRSLSEEYTPVGIQTLKNVVVLNSTFAIGETEDTHLTSFETGVDKDIRTGRGQIAVLFTPPICAFGIDVIQSDRLFSGDLSERTPRTSIHFTFLSRGGALIAEETRSRNHYHGQHAFEQTDANDPIFSVIIKADDQRGFAIKRILGQPCSSEMS